MKRKLLINQYESVRSLIVANIDTMINLVEQAKGLTELANHLKKINPFNLKKLLQKLKKCCRSKNYNERFTGKDR